LYTPAEEEPEDDDDDDDDDDDADKALRAPQPTPQHAVLVDSACPGSWLSVRAPRCVHCADVAPKCANARCAVVAAERADDGRMYLVVRALARLRVRATAAGGAYPRAECTFAPDPEEIEARASASRITQNATPLFFWSHSSFASHFLIISLCAFLFFCASQAYEALGLAAATAAAGEGASCDDVVRCAGAASAAAAGAAGLTWASYYESALSRKPYDGLQRRIVAVARDFFELSDVGAPPAAPAGEVARAAAAAARAAAAAAAEAALSSGRERGAGAGTAADVAACVAEAEAWGGGGAPVADAALCAAEAELWAQYDAVCRLQRALTARDRPAGAAPPPPRHASAAAPAARPPYAARALRPLAPATAAAAFSKLRPPPPSGDAPPPVDDVLPPVPPAERAALALWPPTRRAVRASFALACVLPELSRAAGRQSLLDAPSAAARLRAVAATLAARRATLAALAAVEGMRRQQSSASDDDDVVAGGGDDDDAAATAADEAA
jgi:hypothetical protein